MEILTRTDARIYIYGYHYTVLNNYLKQKDIIRKTNRQDFTYIIIIKPYMFVGN